MEKLFVAVTVEAVCLIGGGLLVATAVPVMAVAGVVVILAGTVLALLVAIS